jgi:hypothetical protein
MEKGLRECLKSVAMGHILIQHDRSADTGLSEPQLYYAHLPPNVQGRHIFLLDPVLGENPIVAGRGPAGRDAKREPCLTDGRRACWPDSGATVIKAIDVLKQNGADPSRIVFLNLFATEDGLQAVLQRFPGVTSRGGAAHPQCFATADGDPRVQLHAVTSLLLPDAKVADFSRKYFGA